MLHASSHPHHLVDLLHHHNRLSSGIRNLSRSPAIDRPHTKIHLRLALSQSLAASFFVPLAWSITLRIFAGFCVAAYGAMGDGAQGTDHNHDILLYQRPNTPLTLHLH